MFRKLILLAAVCCCSAYFLPGINPVDYNKGETVDMKVTKLASVVNQLPYSYWALPFCKPAKIVNAKQNLGEILRGDRITNSIYTIKVLENNPCQVLGQDRPTEIAKWHKKDAQPTNCTHVYGHSELTYFYNFVTEQYRVHWELDNMPVAQQRPENPQEYNIGYSLGLFVENTKDVYLNNHVNINVKYIEDVSYGENGNMGYRIVGFEAEPLSIDYEAEGLLYAPNCKEGTRLKLDKAAETKEIVWTYSVTWVPDNVPWTDRFDRYFADSDSQIHWFSIINSLMIVLFLTGMVAMIMIRTLHADYRKYQSRDTESEAEETGWKLLHADVFRAPEHRILLAVFYGFGAQVFAGGITTLACGLVGFVSPANKGSLLTGMLVLFVLMGSVAGYNSIRLYKLMKGVSWKTTTILTAFLVPGIIFGVFIFIDFFILGAKSSGAIPFKSFVAIVALWFGISVPLVFLGSYIAFKKAPIWIPVTNTNPIPRIVPHQVWYMRPIISILMGGILPFGAIFIELFFVLTAIWNQQFYYIATFLFIVFLILIVTCAEITIVMCYFQLCSEDHYWWWRAFLTPGASAFYVMLYSIFYFFTKLDVSGFVSGLMFFGYTFILSVLFFVVTGFIGFFSCLQFVKQIYGSVPLD